MGCSTSKLDDEEAVQLCKDRKNFIKEAVDHRLQFASGHIAYIQSLKRVSDALRDYIEGDEPREFLLDSYTKTTPFTPLKKDAQNGFISISPNSFTISPIQTNPNSSFKINYLRPSGPSSVSVEERPQASPETVRVETYNYNFNSPMHQYGMDGGFFSMQNSPMNASFFQYSPNNRPNLPPPSPQSSQWDFFWNPFSSLDYYGYPNRSSMDNQSVLDDDLTGLRQVREEEGIPELEEETEQEENGNAVNMKNKKGKVEVNTSNEEVVVEDVDDDDDDDDDEDEDETESEDEVKTPQSNANHSMEVSKAQNVGHVSNQETTVSGDKEGKEETPGFTVYVNQRPTNMAEVIRDLEEQFMIVCDSANEVSAMLEASRAQYSTSSNELTAMKMLNPVALLRSASSRSSSSRFLMNSSTSKDESHESSSDLSDEPSMFSGSHQTTLDKLYAWEKKLYQEVRAGERVRLAYEKKCAQLRDHDVKGDDPFSVDKTRTAIRDLHTQIKVSIHSVESVSKRIETLRDEELQPQLLELIQGLSRMWKVMAECHQTQKRTLDEAKFLLAGTPSKHAGTKKYTLSSPSEPHRLARSASQLEAELRNWRTTFHSWITSQRSYIHALTAWLMRCVGSDPNSSKLPFSPRRSSGAPPIISICIQWSRFLDGVAEGPVIDGLDFFAAGVGSLYAQQMREDSRRNATGSRRWSGEHGGGMEVVEAGQVNEDVMTAEKMAEVAVRVLCAGMSVAVSSLTEFALGSAEGYADLVKQWEKATCSRGSGGA